MWRLCWSCNGKLQEEEKSCFPYEEFLKNYQIPLKFQWSFSSSSCAHGVELTSEKVLGGSEMALCQPQHQKCALELNQILYCGRTKLVPSSNECFLLCKWIKSCFYYKSLNFSFTWRNIYHLIWLLSDDLSIFKYGKNKLNLGVPLHSKPITGHALWSEWTKPFSHRPYLMIRILIKQDKSIITLKVAFTVCKCVSVPHLKWRMTIILT